jgi:hypothetical protein
MSTRNECPTRVSSFDVSAKSTSRQNAHAGMSSREVRARSMSRPDVRRCNMNDLVV